MKVLLVILKFRELPQFREAVKDLSVDKLWIKWYGQFTSPDNTIADAYTTARQEFLKRTEYTHFLLLTDDVIVYQKDIDQLIKDAEENPDKEVISGWFNQDLTDHAGDTNFSFILPPDPPSQGTYEGYHFEPIEAINSYHFPYNPIEPVLHQGTALTLISRKIIEQIPFRNSMGCCIDSCFSLDLAAKGIKQFVDLRVRTLHLKINEKMQWRISEVGKQFAEVVFEPCPPVLVQQ